MTLSDILAKLNLKYDDLNADEKSTYSAWEETLATKELTIGNLTEFIKTVMLQIETDLICPDNSEKKDSFLKAQLRCYKTILFFIESPKQSKDYLEQYLSNLFKK